MPLGIPIKKNHETNGVLVQVSPEKKDKCPAVWFPVTDGQGNHISQSDYEKNRYAVGLIFCYTTQTAVMTTRTDLIAARGLGLSMR